jgi:hypothetical protein
MPRKENRNRHIKHNLRTCASASASASSSSNSSASSNSNRRKDKDHRNSNRLHSGHSGHSRSTTHTSAAGRVKVLRPHVAGYKSDSDSANAGARTRTRGNRSKRGASARRVMQMQKRRGKVKVSSTSRRSNNDTRTCMYSSSDVTSNRTGVPASGRGNETWSNGLAASWTMYRSCLRQQRSMQGWCDTHLYT